MNEYLRLARLYMVVLAIFTVGRLVTGLRGIPYEKGHAIFSLVTMSFLACAFYGAFTRKWLGYSVTKVMVDIAYVVSTDRDSAEIRLDERVRVATRQDRDVVNGLIQTALANCREDEAKVEFLE